MSRTRPTCHICLVACLAASAMLAAAPALAGSAVDLARARALDQQGVRAYRDERYNDAIRFFQEARKLGGPTSEIWNVAKCQVRLDEPEDAAKTIEEYLEQRGLSPADRGEAEQQLRELKGRHSTLEVASSPAGATVYLEGRKWAGMTPATIDVPPGEHKVTIEETGYEPYEKNVTARYGRAIIVEVQLSGNGPPPATTRGGSSSSSTSSSSSSSSTRGSTAGASVTDESPSPRHARPHRLVLGAEMGAELPRFGSIGGSVGVAGLLSAAYVAVDASRLVVTVGVRAMLTGDSWSNTSNLPSTAANCGAPIASDEAATAFSAFVDGGIASRVSARWRLGADLGLGFASYSLGEAGGDLFYATCRPSPGVKPALHLGLGASFAISREMRVLLSPLFFEAQLPFDGARSAPKDATGPWLRFGMGAGLAFDLL